MKIKRAFKVILLSFFIICTASAQNNRVELVTKAYNKNISANGFSSLPHLSFNERYIVYRSEASNLVSGDTNKRADIFIYDRKTKKNKRVSTGPNGDQLYQDFSTSSYKHLNIVSDDGRFVLFAKYYFSHLVEDEYFLKDLQQETLYNLTALFPKGHSFDLSYNGKYLYFVENRNLVRYEINSGIKIKKSVDDFDLGQYIQCSFCEEDDYSVWLLGFSEDNNRIIGSYISNNEDVNHPIKQILLSYNFDTGFEFAIDTSEYIDFSDRQWGYIYALNTQLDTGIFVEYDYYDTPTYLVNLNTFQMDYFSRLGHNYAVNRDFSICFSFGADIDDDPFNKGCEVATAPPKITTEFGPSGISPLFWPLMNSHPYNLYQGEKNLGWNFVGPEKFGAISKNGDFYVLNNLHQALTYHEDGVSGKDYYGKPRIYEYEDIYIWDNTKPFLNYSEWAHPDADSDIIDLIWPILTK